MLVQGETDSLFPPTEGDRTVRAIHAAGVPLKVMWRVAGHDGGDTKQDSQWVTQRTDAWLDRYLWHRHVDTGRPFEFGRPNRTHRGAAPGYGGMAAGTTTRRRHYALHGRVHQVVRPPGGAPAALSTLPGASQVAALAAGVQGELPSQHQSFTTAPLRSQLDVLGASQVRVRVSSPSGARNVVLFAKLYDVGDGGGAPTLPERLASPIRVDLPPGGGAREVVVALPAVSHRVEVGHRLRVTFSTTDQAYAAEPDAQLARVELAPGSGLDVPTAPAGSIDIGNRSIAGMVTLGILALLALAGIVTSIVGRRRHARQQVVAIDDEHVLELRGLTKTWDDGLRAVDDLSFRVERGQVLGLLGPNGAGKTTALRMAMGLIHPDAGSVHVLGQPVTPGAPILGRVGSFVEGAGFLPHLSGRRNLELYWRASGRRPEDAHVEEALEVAGLGTAIDKPVRTYSQGMRQRLAIAQAMLGLPDLLVLDEPTNGLDPPQIREMRDVVRAVAAGGRTVIVSSHLLGEVQQTCTHVVVMHRGRLVASGRVDELLARWGEAGHDTLEDAFMHILASEGAPA
jgi:ABC-2 type transport system ATP-binding protein